MFMAGQKGLERDNQAVPCVKDLTMVTMAGGCLIALVLTLFGQVVFEDRQFAFRDASQWYYPLYLRIQEDWTAGRWPLWMNEANGGMPLLGNPISAVFYPGKLVYAALPYPWAARAYVILHVVLAFGAMVALLRSWGVSMAGAGLGGLSYAFAGPVVFQYANVIFLVGAAWMPLGLRAIDRWLRQGKRSGLIELAAVLSMQVLGGDLQSAYLVGVAGAAYCVWLSRGRIGPLRWVLLFGVMAAFYAVQYWLASRVAWLSRSQPPGSNVISGYRLAAQVFAVIGWGMVIALVVKGKRDLARGLSGLAGAAVLALAMTAVQVWPTLEFAGLSVRTADIPAQDIYAYSLRPVRILEWVWPNVSGTLDRGNRRWMETLPRRYSEDFWVPSIYLGGLALLLACGSAGIRDGPPWRNWLTGLAFVGIMGSLGEYGGPLYWARHTKSPGLVAGPTDPSPGPAGRIEGSLRDGDGGFYWLLTTALPGFDLFRYPGKLLTITSLGLAGLAGLGWDSLGRGQSCRAWWLGMAGLAVTLVALCLVALVPVTLRRFLTDQVWNAPSAFGPLDVSGALSDIRVALGHAAVVMALSMVLVRLTPGWPRAAGSLALVLVTFDLIAANQRIIWTVPQSLFDTAPRLLELIEAAERTEPAQGPFRIHRMAAWQPLGWFVEHSEVRHEEMLRWQRDTLLPLHAVPLSIETTHVLGSTELFDQTLLFEPSSQVANPRTAGALKLNPGDLYVSYPRQSFDLWNTRYFIVPARMISTDLNRGFSSLVPNTDLLYPDVKSFEGPGAEEPRARWLNFEDVRLLRNKAAFPRAWAVHQARFLKPIVGMSREARRPLLSRLVRASTRTVNQTGEVEDDLRQMAWIETDHPEELSSFLTGGQPQASETIRVIQVAAGRVELRVDLHAPGVVVLADVYYPGWTLTIDGQSAEILRVNRMMRGAAVAPGSHLLVYTYRPRSFRLGLTISVATLSVVALLGCCSLARAARLLGVQAGVLRSKGISL
jgi:Bacterial membrane protein YfhO